MKPVRITRDTLQGRRYYQRPMGYPGRTVFNKDRWVLMGIRAMKALKARGFDVEGRGQ